MSRHGKQIGNAGEDLARQVLTARGVKMVQEIGTPVHVKKYGKTPGVFFVAWGKKVAGDHRGLLDNGVSVLAEVKTVVGRNLRWSDLSSHQPEMLSYHKECNGISLLVWVSSLGVFVLDWNFPNDHFRPGKGLTHGVAADLDIMNVNHLVKRKR